MNNMKIYIYEVKRPSSKSWFFAGHFFSSRVQAHLAHALAILNRGPEGLSTCRRAEDLFREVGAVSEQASAVCLSAEIANLMGHLGRGVGDR